MKNTISIKNILLIMLISVVLFECSTTSEQVITSVINPPIKSIEVNKNIFIYAPESGCKYLTNKGTEITILPNSLVYNNGTEIIEKVEITFNEFHNMAEIALSGIPMKYDSNGVSYNFISGGMFSIKAKTLNGETIIVKKGKGIEIKLASIKSNKFNFYELNEQTGNWASKPNKTEQINLNNTFLPTIIPEPNTEEDIVLDLNITKYNKEYEFSSSLWKLSKNITDSQKKIISKYRWTKYEIEPIDEKKLLYKIKLSTKNNSIETEVTPVLSPNNLKKCKEKIASKIREMQKDLASNYYKPRVIRIVKLNGFGTFNFDVFDQNAQEIFASYSVSGVKEEDLQVFQFDLSADRMIGVGKNLMYDPKSKNLLIGLLPNKEIAVFKPDEYETLNNLEKGSKANIILHKTGKTINSADDLYKIILSYI